MHRLEPCSHDAVTFSAPLDLRYTLKVISFGSRMWTTSTVQENSVDAIQMKVSGRRTSAHICAIQPLRDHCS
jgi:hypothetical protein